MNPMGETEITAESEPIQAQVILARGMEDLPRWMSGLIAKLEGAKAFDSNWFKPENFQDKLARFKEMVLEAKSKGGPVIVIGVSAGAGLTLALMLEEPGLIDQLYSCSGVLDPNLNEQKEDLTHLIKKSSSFREMCEQLTAELHPNKDEFIVPSSTDDPTEGRTAKAVKFHHLKSQEEQLIPEKIKELGLVDKITAYSSLGESDRTVPSWTRLPPWIEKFHYVGVHNHVATIFSTLIADLKKDLKKYHHEK